MSSKVYLLIFVLVICSISGVLGAHYEIGGDIPLWVDRVGPFNNPQEYYLYYNLPFCVPDESKGKLEGIGESIAGYELRRSPISISFATPTRSGVICDKKLSYEEASIFAYVVKNQFWYQMFLDDLPLWGLVGEMVEQNNEQVLYIYTHLHFEISKNGNQVISANLTSEGAVPIQEGAEISFTYSVAWSNTEIRHSDRFAKYLDATFFEHQIHWFSLFNSFMLLIFLLGLICMIFLRTIRKEFAVLGEDDPDDDLTDESGWKLLHREVFRAPSRLAIFSSLIGVGNQLIATTLLVLTLGALGAHYYEGRGAIISAFIAWYILTSFVGGFSSGSLFVKHNGTNWIRTAMITTVPVPLVLVLIYGTCNIVTTIYGALSYIPLGTMILLFLMWVILCVPISMVGTLFGRHMGRTYNSGNQRVNQVPRLIPPKPWYHQTWAVSLWGGLLPFSTIFVELFFIYTSVFHYKFYYVYGIAELVFFLLLLTTMSVTVIATYFTLNSEDHKWQWTSFKTGSGVGLYVFLYSLYYYAYRSEMSGNLQFFQFICFNLTLSIAIAMMCSAAGFFAANMFVKRIYRGLKVE